MKSEFISFTLMALAIMGVMAACDDENGAVDSVPCDDELTLEDFQCDAYESLVEQNFTKVASGADTLLQMTCGLESFTGESNTRYAIAENEENALTVFNSQFGYVINENLAVSPEDDDIAIPLGEYGYVKYLQQPTNPAAFATAEVKLKGMPYAMYIQYVPKSYVPNNSYGAYEQGTLVKIGDQLWLCTTSWGGGSTPGTLLRIVDRSDNLLQDRDDYYKRVFFQKNPVGQDPFSGLQFLLSSFEYKEDLYETVKYIATNFADQKDAQYLFDVMNLYRGVGSVTNSSNMKFNTSYYSSGKDYHWKCAHKLYKVELNYVTISKGSFSFKSSGRHRHEWSCKDLGKRYFKENAPYLAERKTFTVNRFDGDTIVWPTIAQ